MISAYKFLEIQTWTQVLVNILESLCVHIVLAAANWTGHWKGPLILGRIYGRRVAMAFSAPFIQRGLRTFSRPFSFNSFNCFLLPWCQWKELSTNTTETVETVIHNTLVAIFVTNMCHICWPTAVEVGPNMLDLTSRVTTMTKGFPFP